MSELRASDALIAETADRQHGVVSTQQLLGIGLGKDQILYRAKIGRLHRIHRGVYAVGRRGLSFQGRLIAATLACGKGAVVSHRSAARFWGLLANRHASVDISVPNNGGRRQRSGIRIHRSSTLIPSQVTYHRGIPVTTAARTISDLERVISPREQRHMVRQAEILGLPIGPDLTHDGTRSELEFLFLELCKAHDLPSPRVNTRIGPFVADFAWPEQGVIVETDGYRFHRGRVAFEGDHARDLELRKLGYNVIHLTYRQVVDRPGETAAVVRDALLSWRKART